MKFKIKRTMLLHSLSKTTKAVSIRTPLPVLTGIKFELKNDTLILTGSDSDITIQTKIEKNEDLKIYEEGSVVLSAKYILEIVRKMNSEYIDIEMIDGLLTTIRGANSEFNLNGTDALDYPRIDLSKSGTHFLLNAIVLKEIISQTKFAASDKETKPILTGINFKVRDGFLECVATDSYRLAKKIVSIEEEISFNITIPQKSLDEISKIIEKDTMIDVYVSDRKVLFVFDTNIIQTRLIDGTYPDTSRLIPSEETYKLEVNSTDLLQAIDRVSLLSNEQNNIIKLEMNDETVILSSFMQEIGSGEESVTSAFYKGDPLQISFSCKYAIEAIRCFSGSKIRISFTGAMKPFIIKELDKEDVIQLVLPVKTY
jgi:DNA polymerase-3 subunit beta